MSGPAPSTASATGNLRVRRSYPRAPYIPSPRSTLLPYLARAQQSQQAYPPDLLPGARDVATAHGVMRCNEFGPAGGRRVLLVHGDATPSPLWLRVAWGLARRGARVMTFDLWGRGYSDSPYPAPHTPALFQAQALYALTSSPLPWTGGNPAGVAIVGYSLGGAIALDFAAAFPHLVRSVVVIAPGGLLRTLPEDYMRFVQAEVELECNHPDMRAGASRLLEVRDNGVPRKWTDRVQREEAAQVEWERWTPAVDREGGAAFLRGVLQWQWDHHEGHVASFYSTARYGPGTADLSDSWRRACALIAGTEETEEGTANLLRGGKLLVILGEGDDIVKPDEMVEDIRKIVPDDKVEFVHMPGGHSLVWQNSEAIVEKLGDWWGLAR